MREDDNGQVPVLLLTALDSQENKNKDNFPMMKKMARELRWKD